MLFIYCFCGLVVLLGILASTKTLKYGLEIAFGLIILISAIRYNWGADYMNYLKSFNGIARYPDIQSIIKLFDGPYDKYVGFEVGWMVLNWLFRPFGFFGFIIFTSAFTNIVYYKFIKNYVSREWYWLALFAYMFDTNLFFVPLSMMRQSFAMVLFVISFKYIAEKRIIPALIIVLFAAMFHKSALILLPCVFLGFLSHINGKILSISYAVVFLIMMLTKDLTSQIILSALSLESFESYGDYFEKMEAADSFGLGFASILTTSFIPCVFYLSDNSQRFDHRLIALMAGLSFLIIPFTLVMGFIGRVNYYFSIFGMVSISLIYKWIDHKDLRLWLITLYMAYTLYSFRLFFKNPDWVTFTHYQTIFGL
jgi:hypothetical protein